MENKDSDIPIPIKVLGYLIIGLVILYFCKELLGYSSAKEFLESQGSLIAGIIAFIAAVIALYSQRESTKKQIDGQREMEEEKTFRAKTEEVYSAVEGLRIKVLLTRPNMVEDTVRDIDVLLHDLARIVMLCRLYRIVDEDLFLEYRKNTGGFLDTWSILAKNYLVQDSSSHEILNEYKESLNAFQGSTNKLLNFLISLNNE